MTLTPEWASAVEAWVTTLRAAGRPETSITTLTSHLRSLARDVEHPWAATPEDVLRHMAAHRWAPETRHAHRSTLRSFYGWAARVGHVAVSPAHDLPPVRRPRPKGRPLPEPTLRVALDIEDGPVRVMLRLGAEHGLRRAEIAVVHTDDVMEDLLGWSLRVHGKGGKTRDVPLADDLALWISARDGWAFPGGQDGHVSPWWCGRLIARALGDAHHPHQLRHRFANAMKRAGYDIETIRDLLGHESIATTQTYLSVDDAERRAAVAAVRVS